MSNRFKHAPPSFQIDGTCQEPILMWSKSAPSTGQFRGPPGARGQKPYNQRTSALQTLTAKHQSRDSRRAAEQVRGWPGRLGGGHGCAQEKCHLHWLQSEVCGLRGASSLGAQVSRDTLWSPHRGPHSNATVSKFNWVSFCSEVHIYFPLEKHYASWLVCWPAHKKSP